MNAASSKQFFKEEEQKANDSRDNSKQKEKGFRLKSDTQMNFNKGNIYHNYKEKVSRSPQFNKFYKESTEEV